MAGGCRLHNNHNHYGKKLREYLFVFLLCVKCTNQIRVVFKYLFQAGLLT